MPGQDALPCACEAVLESNLSVTLPCKFATKLSCLLGGTTKHENGLALVWAFDEHAQLVDLLLIFGAERIAFLSAADLKALGLIDTNAPHDLFWASVKANLGVDTLKLVTNYGRKAFNVDMQNPFALLKFLCPAY